MNKIIQYNVMNTPWPMEDNSIDCCITSPPYWGLRNYGVEGQLGLEASPEEFIGNMVKVFDEVKRVLKPEGTLWLNIGDSYAGSPGGGQGKNGERASRTFTARIDLPKRGLDLKPKDLVGIPWMLAFALRSAGWYLRQDIIWHKPNPMPESAQDRCTKAHEYIFLLSKSSRYYYDAYSIATPYKDKTYTTFGIESKGYGDGTGLIQSENWAASIKERKPKKWKAPDGWDTGEGAHGTIHRNGREKGKQFDMPEEGRANKRSVWTVATAPLKEAHFATFPEELITPCILAGCPKDGVVLDPFMGAGTTALVAKSHGRNYIGFELNPEYIKIAEKRMAQHFGMFTNI